MKTSKYTVSRRTFLAGTAMTALAGYAPSPARAQPATMQLGVLTPLTGAGGFDGPRMLKAMQAVAEEINGTGGLLGKKIELIVEDDQTNPEPAVRAARKLIDVSKVPVIMGTWASAVTTAVAPVCWESKTFLTTVSGADSITHLPHQGYLIRKRRDVRSLPRQPSASPPSMRCCASPTSQSPPTRRSARSPGIAPMSGSACRCFPPRSSPLSLPALSA